jgi:hypothetical protein
MSIYSLDCPTIGCYQNFQCDPEFLNKVVAIAFVKKSASGSINKTTAAAWQQSLFTAYVAGNAFLVLNTSGEKPKPDTATVAGRGMQTTKALAKTHTVTVQDMQGVVYSNVQFYNDMLSNSAKYDFYYFTPNRIWDASGYYVTVIGDPVVTAELNTYQMADVSIQWVSKTNPLPYDFDTDNFLEGLFYTITNTNNVGGATGNNWQLSNGTYIVTFTAALNQTVTGSFIPVWSVVQLDGSADISNLNMTCTDGDLDFVISAGDSGIYNFKVVAESESGCVFGEFEVTLTVA